jgi:hypothetical protein
MAEEKEGADWLHPEREQQQAALQEKGLIFAQRYLVFKQDPRARELLAHWTATVRRQTIAVGASAQEYAYWNARREFIELIHAQIEFAENGLNQPPIRKTND